MQIRLEQVHKDGTADGYTLDHATSVTVMAMPSMSMVANGLKSIGDAVTITYSTGLSARFVWVA